MCTAVRFCDPEGRLYCGRNYDWGCGFGQGPVAVPANWEWQSRHLGPIKTVSGLIGMGIVQQNMPLFFDCVNEDGLYCAGLSYAGGFGVYVDPVEGKTNVASFEIPLWVCSQFTTVDEVEKAMGDLVITNDSFSAELTPMPMHWFIADKDRSIVVEQAANGLTVSHDGFDVLTNQPEFKFHCENMRNYLHLDTAWTPDVTMRDAKLSALGVGPSMMGLPGDPSAISRFVRVAILNANYPDERGDKANLTRLFRTLGAVSMVKGYCRQENGNFEYTNYTGGYSAATKTYSYSTYDDPSLRSITFDACKGIDEPVQLAQD